MTDILQRGFQHGRNIKNDGSKTNLREVNVGNYLLLYHGKQLPQDFEARRKYVADWTKWTREVGNSMLGGRPMVKACTVGRTDVGELRGDPVSGYSIIEAQNMDEAIELSRGIPEIMDSGRVDVYQMYDVNQLK